MITDGEMETLKRLWHESSSLRRLSSTNWFKTPDGRRYFELVGRMSDDQVKDFLSWTRLEFAKQMVTPKDD